jgi:FkbM family methyltransferase
VICLANKIYNIKYGKLNVYLREDVVSDYWAFEGLLFADEYYPLKLNKNDIVLDVGANIGIFTLKVADKVAKVISIEPEPLNFKMLSRNIQLNGLSNVILLNYAVSDRDEVVYFKDTGGTARVFTEGTPIKAKPLDDILEELGNPEVTILKMDIEGYESKALSAFRKHRTIRQMVIETHSKQLTEDVIKILSKWGFQIYDISRVSRKHVIRNIISHPISFYRIEQKNRYATLKQIFRHLFLGAQSPVSADNPSSDQKLLYAFRR